MPLSYDYHIHTYLNGHSDPRQDVRTIIARADELGLERIAITEHIMETQDIDWVRQIRREAEQTPAKCTVLVGAEIDADRYGAKGRLVYERRDEFDIVLGSMHWFPGTDIMPHCMEMPPMDRGELVRRWGEQLLGLAANELVDVIAHPGAMIGSCLKQEEFAEDVLDYFRQAAELSAKHQIAWEMNRLLGWKLTAGQREAYYRIARLAAERGVRLIYGSDAHRPEDIGSLRFVDEVVEKVGGWQVLADWRLPRVSR